MVTEGPGGAAAVLTPPAIPVPVTPTLGTIVPSQPGIVASSGGQTDVTDIALYNDGSEALTIAWIDGNGTLQTNVPSTAPGQSWIIANGAATWESHWYAIGASAGLQCSMSPRQGIRVNFSELAACQPNEVTSAGGTGASTAPTVAVPAGGRSCRWLSDLGSARPRLSLHAA